MCIQSWQFEFLVMFSEDIIEVKMRDVARQTCSSQDHKGLRKTAKQEIYFYPEAAEILKKNTYMDDICVLVTNLEKAEKLKNLLDMVDLK